MEPGTSLMLNNITFILCFCLLNIYFFCHLFSARCRRCALHIAATEGILSPPSEILGLAHLAHIGYCTSSSQKVFLLNEPIHKYKQASRVLLFFFFTLSLKKNHPLNVKRAQMVRLERKYLPLCKAGKREMSTRDSGYPDACP